MIFANMEQLPFSLSLSFSLSLLFTLIILFRAFFVFINIQTKRNSKFPPGPRRLPIIGNLHLVNFNKPNQSLLNLSNKYGPLMLLQLGSFPTVIVSSGDIAKKIFTNHEATFFNRPILTAPTRLLYNNSSTSFATNINQWRQSRKITNTELLSDSRVRSFETVRGEEVNKLVAAIKDMSSVNLRLLTLSFANNVIGRAILGDEFGNGEYGGKEELWLHQYISETESALAGFYVADYFPWMKWVDWLWGFNERLEKNFKVMDKFFDRVVKEHLRKGGKDEESNSSNKKLLHVLLTQHEVESHHEGFPSNMDHVKALLAVS